MTAPTPTAASDLREAAKKALKALEVALPVFPDVERELRAALAASPASKPDEAPDVVAETVVLYGWKWPNDILESRVWGPAHRLCEVPKGAVPFPLVPLAALQSERRKRVEAEADLAWMTENRNKWQDATTIARRTIASQAATIAELRAAVERAAEDAK